MGVSMVGISADAREQAVQLAARLELPFSLLSDTQRRVIGAYGVADNSSEIAVPAVFVISQQGQIVWSYVGENPPDIPTTDLVLEALQRAQGG